MARGNSERHHYFNGQGKHISAKYFQKPDRTIVTGGWLRVVQDETRSRDSSELSFQRGGAYVYFKARHGLEVSLDEVMSSVAG